MDIFDQCREFDFIRAYGVDGVPAYFRPVQPADRPGEVEIDGRSVVMAGSNDYLGLAQDPRLTEAVVRAVRRLGSGCSGSRPLSGTRDLHEQLEHACAAFLGREAAVIAPSGFQTNLMLAGLLGRGDVVLGDRQNHASLVDAVRLSGARYHRYRRGGVDQMEQLLAEAGPNAGKVIVTDGLFSMEGDLCDLPGIVALARRHRARVVVDCAHDLGVLGASGQGVPEHFGLEDQVDLVTATFSKSLGSIGGVLAGPAQVIDFVKYTARASVFTAAMAPPAAAAALAALEIVQAEPARRAHALDVAERMHNGLRALGFDTGHSVSPIIPVTVGDRETCLLLWQRLLDGGVYANPIVAPGRPAGEEIIRASFTPAHTDAQLDRALEAFATAGRAAGVIPRTPPASWTPVRIARPTAGPDTGPEPGPRPSAGIAPQRQAPVATVPIR
ncbi:aminotransferase class I/II-fold pyridoxal phosphate-dependent enzyme [Streptomyces sp. NPDC002088]|uniref:aminotransferase class I/II-fold pyridoxal phosphate-dependent enzyme n=1 Tax=Streptomyces sp. NPDC002088 TaxID=3154665 RepID=UPI003317058C